jgi:hypothetical protein
METYKIRLGKRVCHPFFDYFICPIFTEVLEIQMASPPKTAIKPWPRENRSIGIGLKIFQVIPEVSFQTIG